MAFIKLIFAKMYSVSYGQGVMKYKSNCLGVGASHTITKEKDMYSKSCLKLEGYLTYKMQWKY